MSQNAALPYRREIDGLRAIAIIPVIFFHAGLGLFAGGFVGVDVFFVISGYLISSILVRQIEAGRFSIYDFYERRSRRILPALYFVMLICWPVAWLSLMPRELKDFVNSLLATLTFTSNHLFGQQSGYFDTAAELKPLLHTWSLSVEEQFYLLFPLVLILLLPKGRRAVGILIAGVAVLSLGLAQVRIFPKPAENFYLMPTRGWELLIGAWLGIAGVRPKANEIGALAGLVAVLAACFLFSQKTPFPGIYGLIPTLGTALLIQCATEKTIVGRILGFGPVVMVGLLSYSLYLWHQPILAFSRQLHRGEFSDSFIFLICAFTFVPAYFSWRFVERPFREPAKVSAKKLWIILGVGSVVLVLLALVAAKTATSPARLTENIEAGGGDVAHDEYHHYVDKKYADCEPAEVRDQAPRWNGFLRCKQSRKGPAAIALLGDSHSEHLFPGIAEAFSHLNVVYYIDNPDVSADISDFGVPYPANGGFEKIFEVLSRPDSPKTIVTAMYYAERLGHSPARERRTEKFKAAVMQLLQLGKSVVVVGDVPLFDSDPSLCKFKTHLRRGFICDLDRKSFDGQQDIFHWLREQLGTHPNLEYVELGDRFCTPEKCSMLLNGKLMFRDRNHLNIPGSLYFGRLLTEQSPTLKKLAAPQ